MDLRRPPHLEPLRRDECLELLAEVPVGRVGLTARALPVVLPVNFAVVDESIVWRSAEGTKFNAAANGLVVAFEADWFDPAYLSGWSVMVQGVAQVVEGAEHLAFGEQLSLESWALDGAASHLVRLPTEFMTGMRIRVGSQGDLAD